MNDVPEFIHKAEAIYGYKHFINDAGGSVCELDSPDVLKKLAEHTLILYIKIPESLEQTIIDRAKNDPKPLYYRPEFVDEKLNDFLKLHGYTSTDQIIPNDFVSWVFPQLFKSRVPRYEAIAKQYGYTISADQTANVSSEEDFMQLIAEAIAQQNT